MLNDNKNGAKKRDELAGLTLINKKKNKPSRKLESFPNRNVGRNYLVELHTQEFTCLCPATAQPDFANIKISYVPDKKIVESKSLKLYLWSFRDEGCFHEHAVNKILDDIVKAINPLWCEVYGAFNVRGGIGINVKAVHGKRPEDV